MASTLPAMLAAGASPSWAALANVDNTVALTSCTASRAAIAIAVRWIGSISRSNTSIVACSPAITWVSGSSGNTTTRSTSPSSRERKAASLSLTKPSFSTNSFSWSLDVLSVSS